MKKTLSILIFTFLTASVNAPNTKNQKRSDQKLMRTILWSQNCYKILGLSKNNHPTEADINAAYSTRTQQVSAMRSRKKATALSKLNQATVWALVRLRDDDI